MSCERFSFLVNCLRFDKEETRQERTQIDSFAAIRDFEICRTSYIPSAYLAIEQLLGFHGRCPFRMYIPSKSSKYGIKIVMLCNSASKYMIDASPYLGKNTYVKKLTQSVHGSKRNITMDNWFTSVGLVDELLRNPYNLTI